MIFSDLVGIIADDLTGSNDTALSLILRFMSFVLSSTLAAKT